MVNCCTSVPHPLRLPDHHPAPIGRGCSTLFGMQAVDAFSTSGLESRELYERLLAVIEPLGTYQVEVKKTSIHLVRKTAFAGVRILNKAPELLR